MSASAASANQANQDATRSVRHGVVHAAAREVRLMGLVNVSKSRTVDVKKATPTTDGEPNPTSTMPDDPLGTLAERGKVIESPFDMLSLAMLPEYSSELGQCIESMQVNCEGFGHRQVPRVKIVVGDEKGKLAIEVRRERTRLTNFFEYCTVESFTEFRKKLRKDLESTGNAYIEVIRDSKGDIQSFAHVPSYQVRLSRQDEELTLTQRKILKMNEDGEVVIDEVDEWRRFRTFVQCRSTQRRNLTYSSAKMRWFKSFGDKRFINNETGDVATEALAKKLRANEMIHLSIYSARSPYGLPRYVGNLLSVYGDRAAEEINYTTFRNNNIPSMAVMVSNGQLTQGTVDRINAFVEAQIQGSDNYSKFVIIEGETMSEDGEDGGQIKIDIKPLTNEQISDAMFQKYSENNQDKIRRAFRLPPILVGKAQDYNRATAEAAIKLADEQVFQPERDSFDAIINRMIYPEMGIRYHKFKSNSPVTTDNEVLVGLLASAEKTGAMTPRIARKALASALNDEDIENDFPADADFDPDLPFSLQMAKAVKNMAEPAEPGQQVTAVKAIKLLKALGVNVDAEAAEGSDPFISYLVELNKAIETGWRQEAVAASATED